jgi:hypothetical protein
MMQFCFVYINIKIKFQNKIEGNSEIWVYNNVCSIYVIYYFLVNQMLIYKKSNNDT